MAGINWKEFKHYVDVHGLPAFKIDGKGQWIALPADIEKWVCEQRDRWLK